MKRRLCNTVLSSISPAFTVPLARRKVSIEHTGQHALWFTSKGSLGGGELDAPNVQLHNRHDVAGQRCFSSSVSTECGAVALGPPHPARLSHTSCIRARRSRGISGAQPRPMPTSILAWSMCNISDLPADGRYRRGQLQDLADLSSQSGTPLGSEEASQFL